jgi:hypothetical protein
LKSRILVAAFVFYFCIAAGYLNGATYVVDQRNPDADDRNPGTADRPLKTIGAAVDKVQAGDEVQVKGGIYRELVQIKASGTPGHPIILRGAVEDPVVITGADPVADWSKSDNFDTKPIWIKKQFAAWASYDSNLDTTQAKPQLIYDGAVILEVEDLDALHPGTYCYNKSNGGTIYFWPPAPKDEFKRGGQWGAGPTNVASVDLPAHEVETSVRPCNLRVAAGMHDINISGIIARFSSGGFPNGGCGIELGVGDGSVSNVTLENSIVEFVNGGALYATGTHLTIRSCLFRYGGLSSGALLADSLLENCTFDGNNARGIDHNWSSGGIKFLRSARLTIRGCKFINNDGPGVWFDWGNSDNTVERNLCANNYGPGIMVEVSPHFASVTNPHAAAVMDDLPISRLGVAKDHPPGPNILRNNICVGNRWDGIRGCGILLQMASNCHVLNNTVCNNERYGIFVYYHPNDGAGHRCVNNVILNNLCADNGGSQIYLSPDPVDKPGFVANNRSDYNLMFSHEAWRKPGALSESTRGPWPDASLFDRWGKVQCDGTYSVFEWFKVTGYDEHSLQAEPLLTSPATMDFTPLPMSAAIGGGTVCSEVTDDFSGRKRPTSRAPTIGAIEYFGTKAPGDDGEPKP